MARIKQFAKRYKMNPRKSKRLAENQKEREEEEQQSEMEEEEETEKGEMPKTKTKRQARLDDPSYCQYKCNMMAFHEQLTRVKNILGHDMNLLRIELKKTPFWNLIKVYDEGYMSANEGKKSDRQMHMFIECFNPKKQKFMFGNRLAEISANDVKHIFGLPNSGVVVPNPAALSQNLLILTLFKIISRMRPESQSPEYCFVLGMLLEYDHPDGQKMQQDS